MKIQFNGSPEPARVVCYPSSTASPGFAKIQFNGGARSGTRCLLSKQHGEPRLYQDPVQRGPQSHGDAFA
jgi:hypothetical protein